MSTSLPATPKSPPASSSAQTFQPARPSPLATPLSPPSGPVKNHPRRSSAAASEAASVSSSSKNAGLYPGLKGLDERGKGKGKAPGLQDRLRNQVDGVVKRRSGGVLGRGYILKTDHYPTGRAMDLELTIQGAPNFRAPEEESLSVFGVAQPTSTGLKSILTLLACQPYRPSRRPNIRRASVPASSVGEPSAGTQSQPQSRSVSLARVRSEVSEDEVEEGKAIWFSTREETLVYCNGRPYVLRDASTPYQTLALSDRADNLEDIERRLKLDILDEARKYGGMILTHEEITGGTIIPTWVSVDEESLRTPKEVWEDMKNQGYRVEYYRIPIAPDTPIEHNYLDAYVSVLKSVDPLTTALVFNCGMGVVRTTFAMCAAMLIRRKQLLLEELDDPFGSATASGVATPSQMPQAAQFLEQASLQQSLNKSLLKVTRVLDRNLPSKHPSTAIDLLTSQPTLLEQLRKAHMGSYQIVMSLLSSLDHGRQMKRLVDAIIDSCDAVINLRENVIEHRIKYSVSSMDDKNRQVYLEKALRSLEQYFDLIVFASYVEEEDAGTSGTTFSSWLKSRPEIWNQIKVMRRSGGNRLFAFAPVNDLSLISRSSELAEKGLSARHDLEMAGGKVLGDEWAEHVVTNRAGIMLRASTLLKSDLWVSKSASSSEGVRGAIGFRQIKGSTIYATGQPTQDAISTILHTVHQKSPSIHNVIWVCLREEPLVMINGSPYCLRRDSTALRNMRDYSGVSSSRLEVLEQRLKSDVIAEIDQFQGRVLLHTETADGEVVPVWESVDAVDVASLREVMDDAAAASKDVHLQFIRIPVTSETSPDFHDITELLELCMRTDLSKCAIVLNDQLGRGRSSTTAVIVLLIQQWLTSGKMSSSVHSLTPNTPSRGRPNVLKKSSLNVSRTSWQVINSCLRVVRHGLDVKQAVDEAIDATSTQFNLREAIEDTRQKAQEAQDPTVKRKLTEKGLYHLKRYFHLILFQAYLDDRAPDDEDPYSFESFVRHRPVFRTLEKELEEGGLQSLAPIERIDPADGMALPDEVTQVVANRSGAILSGQTILKSDFFSGLQKQSLPERVDGAANYRRVPLLLEHCTDDDDAQNMQNENHHYVYGSGMPSSEGLRNALEKMDAGSSGQRTVTWTSLREEPVLYVKSRPHVLRLVDKPVTNIETTGVTAAVVERMEVALKRDVVRELRQGEGRLLLHDEVETKPGVYDIIPIWETVEESEIMTPKELYESVIAEGYKVDYVRVAITDEQAPLPVTFGVLVKRIAEGLNQGTDFVFNCQMGRGRTTTGMTVACLIASIDSNDDAIDVDYSDDESDEQEPIMETNQYLKGEYKTILQLVTVMSHGKEAKKLADHAINLMEGVQNLRKAVYDFKLQVDAAEPGSAKHKAQSTRAINYLYRYGALIVLANFLLEAKEKGIPLKDTDFPAWFDQHREIGSILSRKGLD